MGCAKAWAGYPMFYLSLLRCYWLQGQAPLYGIYLNKKKRPIYRFILVSQAQAMGLEH